MNTTISDLRIEVKQQKQIVEEERKYGTAQSQDKALRILKMLSKQLSRTIHHNREQVRRLFAEEES